jgi:transketolase
VSSLRKVFAELLVNNGRSDPDLIVLVGDISHGLLSQFRSIFPDRYFNIGICEPAMVGLAAGLRIAGFNPVIHTIAPFLIERSYEQIKLDFGYQGLGGNFVSVGGSFDYSKLGCSHHSYSDVSMMAQLPRSNVFVPGSSTEFTELFNRNYKNKEINYFRLTENPHGHEFSPKNISSGEAILVKEGNDITIAALGPMLKVALESSQKLAEQGINAEVLYYHTFKPFDAHAVIKSVKKTNRIATVEELSSIGGLNSLALESCAGILLKSNLKFAVNNFVRSYGSYSDMLIEAELSTEHIVNVITRNIKK